MVIFGSLRGIKVILGFERFLGEGSEDLVLGVGVNRDLRVEGSIVEEGHGESQEKGQ